jgi:hypothetical protein
VHVRGLLVHDGDGRHTSGELHEHPVRLDGIFLDEVDQDADVHVAGLDHLGEDEALCVRLSRHARAGQKRGRLQGGIANKGARLTFSTSVKDDSMMEAALALSSTTGEWWREGGWQKRGESHLRSANLTAQLEGRRRVLLVIRTQVAVAKRI